MTKKNCLLFFTFCLLIKVGYSQKYTISGRIEDADSGEHIIGACIYDSNDNKYSSSNNYGLYSLTLNDGEKQLNFTFVGYTPITVSFNLSSDTIVNIKMRSNNQLEEVVVTANRNNNLENTQLGLMTLDIPKTKLLPVFMGEFDIIKNIQQMPGIRTGNDVTSGIYVRGGGQDQNFILLDGVPVYNASHLLGFFSIFNTDAIQKVSIYKGDFPARYGGRLSSVLDVRMKEGNNKEIQGNISLGLISSKATLEGPIIKDKSSFIVSARRTYLDGLMYLYQKFNGYDFSSGYYFYDLSLKTNYTISSRTRLYLSVYNGKDNMSYSTRYMHSTLNTHATSNLGWGNIIGSLRLNQIITDKLFSNITLNASNYDYFIKSNNEENGLTKHSYIYSSGISDYCSKVDFDYVPNSNHYVRFGVNYSTHIFKPGAEAYYSTVGDTTYINQKIDVSQIAYFIEDDFTITSNFKINAGVHIAHYLLHDTNYNSIQPRLSLRYAFSNYLFLKGAYSRMVQHLHLLSSSNVGLPTDIWLPITKEIKPAYADQYSIGVESIVKHKYKFSIECYYKLMENLLEYKDGESFLSFGEDWAQSIVIGGGISKGIELQVEKNAGKLTGAISYALSKTDRKFPDINNGLTFPHKYDQRHNINLSAIYHVSNKFNLGIIWVYASGNAATVKNEQTADITNVTGNYGSNTSTVEYFSHRNLFRLPSYHRLDISANLKREIKYGERTLSLGFYNAYNRQNPLFVDWRLDDDQNYKLMMMSIFPIMPFINYSLNF